MVAVIDYQHLTGADVCQYVAFLLYLSFIVIQLTISRCRFVATTLALCGHHIDKPRYCHVVLLTSIDVAAMFFCHVSLRVIDVVATLFLNEKLLVFATFFPHSFTCNATYFPRSSHVF